MALENTNQIMIQMGERLRSSRENLGYDRDDFAKALGITKDHYRKIENGKIRLNTDKIVILHKLYKIDINYLLTGKQSNFLYKGKEYGSLDELWNASDDETKLELCKEVMEYQKKVAQRKAERRLKK